MPRQPCQEQRQGEEYICWGKVGARNMKIGKEDGIGRKTAKEMKDSVLNEGK
jgi:hypothetical protein